MGAEALDGGLLRAALDAAGRGPVRLHLVRHGRTAYNADGRLRGLADPALDEAGHAEAAEAARWLATQLPDGLWTSPLLRASQTAEAVTRATGLTAQVDPRLRDRDYGPWTGAPQADVVRRFGTLDAAPGVESRNDLAERLAGALRDALTGGCVAPVLVTHVACITAVLGAVLGAQPDAVPQRTGACNVLLLGTGAARVEQLDLRPGSAVPGHPGRPPGHAR